MAIADNLQGYWKFNDNRLDSSGNGRDLDAVGVEAYDTGKLGQGYDLPGTDGNRAERPGNDTVFDFTPASQNYSIMAWVNHRTPLKAPFSSVINKLSANALDGWGLLIGSTGIIQFAGRGVGIATSGAGVISPDTDHLVIVVSDGVDVKVYVDDVEEATGSALDVRTTTNPVKIGERTSSTGSGWDGILDEVALWDRALSAAERTFIFNGGVGIDLPEAILWNRSLFQRFLKAKFPPLDSIRARTIRRPGVPADDFTPVAGTPVDKFQRILFSKHPPFNRVRARMGWRFGVAEDPPPITPALHLRRYLRAKWPPVNRIKGSVTWRFGFPPPPPGRLDSFQRFLKAKFPPLNSIRARMRRAFAVDPLFQEFMQTYQQAFRVADDSLNLFELFLGEDAPVDFDASGQPVASSPTLPFSFTPTPPGAGEKVLNIVVRKTNAYGIQSFNVFETLRSIDAAAAEVLIDPSAPRDLNLYDNVTGSFKLFVWYPSGDDTDPADTWEIYAEIGVDPIPGTDVPKFTGAMILVGAEAGLQEVIGGFSAGDTVHVIATALRTSDGARGNSAAVLITLAPVLDLDDGLMFGGNAYEAR